MTGENRRISLLLSGVLIVALIGSLLYSATSKKEEKTEKTSPEPINSIVELPNRFKDIQAIAYSKMREAVRVPVENPMEIELLVSPNSTSDCSEESIDIIRSIENAYKGALLPKRITILFGSETQDFDWLLAETGKRLKPRFRSNVDGKEINPETVNDLGEGVLWASNPCRNAGKLSVEEETEIAHGFAHVIQTMQFTQKADDWGRWGEVPRWILEGGATFTHNYWRNQADLTTYRKNSENFGDTLRLGQDFYYDFLKFDKSFYPLWDYTEQWPNERAYDVGSYLCQALVALEGPASIMNLYREYLKVRDFEESFRTVYGMTWSEAHPYFARSIFKMIRWNVKEFMPWYNPDGKVKI